MDHSYLAAFAANEKRFDAALREVEEALSVLRDLHQADPRNVRTTSSLAHNLTMKGRWLASAGKKAEALIALKEALALDADAQTMSAAREALSRFGTVR